MAKKREEDSNREKNNDESDSGSYDVFKSLFGDIREQGTSASIFSEDNPFRRKPSDSGSVENTASPKVCDVTEPESNQQKDKKKKKEKKRSLDSHSVNEAEGSRLEIKKSKRVEPGQPGSDVGRKAVDGPEANAPVSSGVEKKEKEKEKNKKRKRGELEAEYEARRFGVAVLDEEREGGSGRPVVGEKRKKLDNPEDMMVSKDGFDDEDKLLRTVFVGNLPLKVKKKALLREFEQFGEVESVRIRSIPLTNTKVPRKGAIIKKQINESADSVHAYIVFKSEESARASLAHNMAVVGGNHIRVDRACPPRKKVKGDDTPLYDNKRTVFVGNLPFDVKDEEIYQLFAGINNLESSIEAVRVIRDPNTGVGKGIAYLLFKTRDAVTLVIRKRNFKLRDRDLRLSHAKLNPTPSKRKNSSPTGPESSPAKKLAVDSRSPYSNNKVKTKAAISYQGLRASKSGVQKKVHSRNNDPANLTSNTRQQPQPKERLTKRPAVAARKARANANALKGSGGPKQAGIKRKTESRTPTSERRNKKARKFK